MKAFQKIISGVLLVFSVSSFLAGNQTFADNEKVITKLEAIIENAQKTSRVSYSALTSVLRDDQYFSRKLDLAVLRVVFYNFTASVLQYKYQLEAAAELLELTDYSANEYWQVVSKEYYEYLGLLYRVSEQYGRRLGFTNSDVEKFNLEVSNKAATYLQAVMRDGFNPQVSSI